MHVDFAQNRSRDAIGAIVFDQAHSANPQNGTKKNADGTEDETRQQLTWAARLHESGAAIAQAAFQNSASL